MKEKTVIEAVLELLPAKMREEILRLGEGRRDFDSALSEIRLRAEGRSSLVIGGVNLPVISTVSLSQMADILRLISHNSLYAYRDSINEGYIPMEGGVRVGICGTAKYEGGKRVGICDVSSLVFRIPHRICDTGAALFKAFCKNPSGMLVYSAPGVGKTTALRSLAKLLGTGDGARRVVVVDERCEFLREDYKNATVDLMRGYRRAEGIEIATRTLSAELIIVDELGAEDVPSILPLTRSGIPLIATLHASSLADALERRLMKPLYEADVFHIFGGIFRTGGSVLTKITDKDGNLC